LDNEDPVLILYSDLNLLLLSERETAIPGNLCWDVNDGQVEIDFLHLREAVE